MAVNIKKFGTIELLYDDLVEKYGHYVAMPQKGGGGSLSGFGQWFHRIGEERGLGERVVFFPSDPSAFLIFPTVRQEIEFFKNPSDIIYGNLSPVQIAREFLLAKENIDQPIHTLSGGEKTKAALLKLALILHSAKEVSIASPAHWLDGDSIFLLDIILDRSRGLDVNLTIHVLDGDFWLGGKDDFSIQKKYCGASPFVGFKQSGFVVNFDGVGGGEFQLRYDLREMAGKSIPSPVLLVGRNGSGKSVFAKCMAGMLVDKHQLTPWSGMGAGFGRIILQDCLLHYFRNEIMEHPSRVFDFDSEAMKRTGVLFRDLCSKVRKIVCNGGKDDPYLVGSDLDPSTLMQAKLMLVAERLAYCPPLLVLDEPSWGLSLAQAHAFLLASIECCHEKGVPVVVISHDRRPLPFGCGGVISLERNGLDVSVDLVISEK